MNITQIRIGGAMPTAHDLERLCIVLVQRLNASGFITNANVKTRCGVKVSQRMRSFSIDTSKMPKNVQYNPFRPNGKLTNLPTWDQRVEYNNIVNAVLNELDISANVKSGPYEIRQGMHCFNENNWHAMTPDWVRHNQDRGHYVDGPNDRSLKQFEKTQRAE